jgi:hypothetical protein
MASVSLFTRTGDEFSSSANVSGNTINLSIDVDGLEITIFDWSMGDQLQAIVDALLPVIAEARTRKQIEAEVFARLNPPTEVEA